MRDFSSILDYVSAASERDPTRLALLFAESGSSQSAESLSLDYGQLEIRSNRLAHFLRAQKRFSPGAIIAVYTHRSLETVVAMLAVLKAGAAFVPIDPMYPAERIAYMLEQCEVPLILTQTDLVPTIGEGNYEILILDDELRPVLEGTAFAWAGALSLPNILPEDLAYVIFTSGSTGRPKGCLISHRAAAAFVESMLIRPGLKPSHRFLANASISFDMMVYEIFFPLAAGASVVITSRDVAADGSKLVQILNNFEITGMMATPASWRLILDAGWQGRQDFHLVSAGEALSQDLAHSLLKLSDEVWNMYGPTETTVITTAERVLNADQPIALGLPTQGVRLYVVNEQGQLVFPGDLGELWIGGPQVGSGYLKSPELTQAKFIANTFDRASEHTLLYRTGDLVRELATGRYEYLGRIDHQVKIRGFRIELGEIEAKIAEFPTVRHVVCLAREDIPGDKRLVAYVLLAADQLALDILAMKRTLAKTLPDYMIPMHIVVMNSFPVTANGKLDRKAFPIPHTLRSQLSDPFQKPVSPLEETLAQVFAELLQYDSLSRHDQLFEMGLNSLGAIRAAALLAQQDVCLAAGEIFEYPTIASLADALQSKRSKDAASQSLAPSETSIDRDVAIIGMSVRLPGAANIQEYWQILCEARESIDRFSESELSTWVSPTERLDPHYVAARGLIGDVSRFDAEFFGVSPSEAAMIDPQQRVFLEESWHALEDAGYVPEKFTGRIGVFAGSHRNSYFIEMLKRRPEAIASFGDFAAMIAAEKDFLAMRVAHRLNLTGPALTIQTACSTSLVAIASAVEALRRGECEMALAGGVTVSVPQKVGHVFQEGNILSGDGHCKPFSIDASGTLFSDGVGVVLLKSREAAERDGDSIYALIKGVAVNNDGGRKASFSAPSIEGQLACLKAAQRDAGISAKDISYIEAHGTATPIGDPMEVQAIRRAIAHPERQHPCRIGSVKGNIGHTVAASGVAGLIKTAQSLYHRQLTPSLHAEKTNPDCTFDQLLMLQKTLEPWGNGDSSLLAGVSSFGVGGTNAHAILSASNSKKISEKAIPRWLLLPTSALSEQALQSFQMSLLQSLNPNSPGIELARASWTLMKGRREHRVRSFAVIDSQKSWSEQRASIVFERGPLQTPRAAARSEGEWVWVFPGQGAQYPGMAREVYAAEPEFREWFDRAHAILMSQHGINLHELILEASSTAEAQALLRSTRITQVSIFVVSYALARFWLKMGLKPKALVGHSVGEFVAAALSGVMSFESALALVVARGALVEELPQGKMLSIRAGAERVLPLLASNCSIAAINSKHLCVASGPEAEILDLKAKLEQQALQVRLLETSHAFHSPMMDQVVAPLRDLVAQHQLHEPQIPIYSCVNAALLSAEQACDPSYWGHHVRGTVDFAGAIEVLGQSYNHFLEIGPRAGLSTMIRQILKDAQVLSSLSPSGDPELDHASLLKTLGHLWLRGNPMNWQALGLGAMAQRSHLPGYPFQGAKHWNLPDDSPVATKQTSINTHSVGAHTMEPNKLVNQVTTDLSQLFENLSGMNVRDYPLNVSFLEMGMDSLALTQIAIAVEKKYRTKIGFRDLMEKWVSIESLAEHLLLVSEPAKAMGAPMPKATEAKLQVSPVVEASPSAVSRPSIMPVPAVVSAFEKTDSATQQNLLGIFNLQLQIIQGQVALLNGQASPMQSPSIPAEAKAVSEQSPVESSKLQPPAEHASQVASKPFGAIARISKLAGGMTASQKALFDRLCARYTAKTKSSKLHTQEYRAFHADPRVVTGFRPEMKELIYPLVMKRSKGAYLWDMDGNSYIDLTCGFGSNFFGNMPDWLEKRLVQQLSDGIEIGPQHHLAGQVAKKLSAYLQHDRVAFCNTGSEAVLGALRVARTVTGRSKVISFTGSYHGIIDEVIVRSSKSGKSFPAAPGIMPSTVENIEVLDYGTDESLARIRAQSDDLAAILVEGVQSRRPDFRPKAFLQELRKICDEAGIVLVMDEIITGFRTGRLGAQGYYGIKADLATYGKVIGGGASIGVIAGKKTYMDALDGGPWSFGDHSTPEVGVTYFAGTFVRHPLALAAMDAVLDFLTTQPEDLAQQIMVRADRYVARMNQLFKELAAPYQYVNFGSMMKLNPTEDLPHLDLLVYLLRDRGIHTWDGFPNFLTVAHTDADLLQVEAAFRSSLLEMKEAGFFNAQGQEAQVAASGPGFSEAPQTPLKPERVLRADQPPVPGARLGRDSKGLPAWFVPAPGQTGQYIPLS